MDLRIARLELGLGMDWGKFSGLGECEGGFWGGVEYGGGVLQGKVMVVVVYLMGKTKWEGKVYVWLGLTQCL